VGLGGELRTVNKIEQRISEAEKLGFEEVVISRYNQKSLEGKNLKIKVRAFGKLNDVFQELFG
jgi:DNA repair protein RadA/Sms